MNTIAPISILFVFATLGGCTQASDYGSKSRYLEYTQRTDTITMTAGNDQAVNLRIHENDPWPIYVADTRITSDGQRMAGAVERYRDVSQLGKAPQPLPIQGTQ